MQNILINFTEKVLEVVVPPNSNPSPTVDVKVINTGTSQAIVTIPNGYTYT